MQRQLNREAAQRQRTLKLVQALTAVQDVQHSPDRQLSEQRDVGVGPTDMLADRQKLHTPIRNGSPSMFRMMTPTAE